MKKLEKLLKFASENNEFYQSLIKDSNIHSPLEITQYPVLNRKKLQENRYNMFSDGGKAKYYSQKLHRQTSSGSSGVPINVYWDQADLARSNLALWRLRAQYYGITPTARKVMFTLAAYNAREIDKNLHYTHIGDNVLAFNVPSIQNDQAYMEAINIIDEFQPEWFYIQPSVLMQLVRCYKEYDVNIPKSLCYIESVGELLPKSFQKEVSKLLGIPVANMYGSEEHNGIALECPDGHMHIIADNVYVEVMAQGKIHDCGEGEAIITNLNNYTMPLIRYNQGDIIKVKKQDAVCHCGSYAPIIDVIMGRQYEIIYENENQISALLLSEIVSEIQNQYNDPISEFQFVYEKSSKCLTLYVSLRQQSIAWRDNIYRALTEVYKAKIKYNSLISFYVCDYSLMAETPERLSGKQKILQIED